MALEFIRLDVRPIIAGGAEPFPAIMAVVENLEPGQGLTLLAPFNPLPLLPVMERKGFLHHATALEGGDFEVKFMPRMSEIMASENVRDDEDWPDPVRSFDFSDLDPPQPMTRILAELETMAPGEVLFAVLATEPLFLFQELTRRGHAWAGNHDRLGTAFRIMVKRGADKG